MSYQSSNEDKKRLKKLYDETKNSYGPGAWYDEDKDRYVRLDFTSTWLKHYCRKSIRRKMKSSDTFNQKGLYKKYFDYWWELF